jgi:hypothetical protein
MVLITKLTCIQCTVVTCFDVVFVFVGTSPLLAASVI